MRPDESVTFFARTDFRNERRRFGIRRADRRYHMYVLGRTGMGKSSLLQTLIRQDLWNGDGVALIDPHGDLVQSIVGMIPSSRSGDVCYFDLADPMQQVCYNPLDCVARSKRPLVAANLIDAFKKIWSDSWGVRMEHILRHVLLTLLDQPDATIADIVRIFDDDEFRRTAIRRTLNDEARRFWISEYARYPARFRSDALGPIQNKIGAFLADPVLRRKLTSPQSTFQVRTIMDEGRILLVNLAKGQVGESPAGLVGALLVAQISAAGLSRGDSVEDDRRDFFVYLDEFHSYTTQTLAVMLAELRKYRVNLILANQHLSQMSKEVADSILGNAGSIVAFRVGPSDARVLAQEFSPVFPPADLMNLGRGQIYLRLMIDGVVSKPFSAETLSPAHFSESASP